VLWAIVHGQSPCYGGTGSQHVIQVISLKKLWSAEQPPVNEDPLRVIRLLLQGIALHAVEGDREDHEKFRRDMQALLDAVGTNPSTAILLVTTGSALKTLENYNQSTTRYLRMQGAELQNMIGMLTKTVATLGSGSNRSVTRLREIEGQLEKASEIQDVRMLKLRMEQCLESIRQEAQEQKAESSRIVEGLQNDILQTQERIHPSLASLPDPVTGLPVRADAETALAKAAAGAKQSFVVLLAVDRFDLINGRFGYAAGDEVLRLYLEALRTRLSPADRIFRWNGPAFVVLLERPNRLESVRDQFRSVVPAKMEKTIHASNRTAMVSVSATWTVFSVTPPVANLIDQLDKFLANRSLQPAK
jgi:diguanylate cyclase (GGDEF)-like protein